MQIESKMRFVIVLLLKFDLIQGKENTSTEKVWEKWGKPFGCKEDYLVLNYQNRNPIRGACLPRGYAENVAPIPDGTTGILVSYNHIKFLDLKEKQNTFTVDVKKSYYWQDHTIVANVDNYTNHIIFVPEVEFPALWKPSPKISNMKTMKPALEPSVYTELQLLIGNNVVSKYTVLKVTMEYWVTIYCSLDFQDFPFDIQKCTFKDVNRAKDRHTWLLDSTNQLYQILRKLDQDFEMIQTHKKTGRGFDIIVELRNFTNGNGFEIELKRLIGPYLLQYYVPCFSIVGMSFVSFLVPYSAIPGRIALIATQFLTLTNIFVHHMVIKQCRNIFRLVQFIIVIEFSKVRIKEISLNYRVTAFRRQKLQC